MSPPRPAHWSLPAGVGQICTWVNYGVGRRIVFPDKVMASAAVLWFSARPSRLAPARSDMEVDAINVPFMIELVPSVTLLPAVQ